MALAVFGAFGCGDDGAARDGGGGGGDGGPGGSDAGPSSLPVDCVDRATTDRRCEFPMNLSPGEVGGGPSLRSIYRGSFGNPEISGGFADAAGNRLVAAVTLGSDTSNDYGAIVTIDLDSGDRTVVSGEFEDSRSGLTMVGAGQSFGEAFDVRAGVDGWYVWGSLALVRVDPATGDRTDLWDAPANPCPCRNVNGISMAAGAAGEAYLSMYNPGNGIAEIADGSCGAATLVGHSDPSMDVGGGLVVTSTLWEALQRDGDRLYASLGGFLVYVDLVTGDRIGVSSPDRALGVGDADLGRYGLAVHGDRVWTAGSSTSRSVEGYRQFATVVAADVETGDREVFYGALNTPLVTGGDSDERVWVHPDGETLIMSMDGAVFRYDPATGNAFVLSY